jgi:hypothetical protein
VQEFDQAMVFLEGYDMLDSLSQQTSQGASPSPNLYDQIGRAKICRIYNAAQGHWIGEKVLA